MADVAFVACAKTKASAPALAATLYTSPLYRKSLLAALDRTRSVFILSAKHGLLNLGDRIAPYEQTLKTMSAPQRAAWGVDLKEALSNRLKPGDRALFYSGADYVAPLEAIVRGMGCRIELPLGRLSLGARLQQLRLLNDEEKLESMRPRFNRLMRRLFVNQRGGRPLSECSGRAPWPARGVYLVVEPGVKKTGLGITRIGTHAVSAGSRTTLWDRISTHRGTNYGGGSHRSSIFRSHVGRALLVRGGHAADQAVSWGVGQTAAAEVRAAEADLEQKVSAEIGRMHLLWLDIPDEPGPKSDRAYLERNLIGFLSRSYILDPAGSEGWLGEASPDWRINASGLWNLDHLFYRPDDGFLDVLEFYIDVTAGLKAQPSESVAPDGWHQPRRVSAQLDLFEQGGSNGQG